MVGGWQTKFNVCPGLCLWSLVLGPSGPDLDLTWDLDLSLKISPTWTTTPTCKLLSMKEGFNKKAQRLRMSKDGSFYLFSQKKIMVSHVEKGMVTQSYTRD